VRVYDLDRFLLSLLVGERYRAALWALFAFNHEIAKTREVVSETQLGLIRLQWWRERIGEIYEGKAVAEHEVLQVVAAAIKEYNLRHEYFENLIYAREFDLEDVLPANMDGLLHYADYTGAPLMRLVMQVMGDDPEGEIIQKVAVNYALTGLIRAVSFHASQRRCYLPQDIMKAHNVRPSHLYEGKAQEGLPNVIQEVSGHIVDIHKPKNRFLRASQKLAMMYRNKIHSCDYNIFAAKMAVPPAFKELRLFLS